MEKRVDTVENLEEEDELRSVGDSEEEEETDPRVQQEVGKNDDHISGNAWP